MREVCLCANAYVRVYGKNAFCWSQTSRCSRCFDISSPTGVLLRKLSKRTAEIVSDDLVSCVDELKDLEIVHDLYTGSGGAFTYGAERPYTSFGFCPKTTDGVQIVKKYFRENPTPFTLHFDLTVKCNEKCIHCYIPPTGRTTELDVETVCRVLTEFREAGGLHVEFSGGECFLFDGFREVIACAQELDLSISIMSNLVCIDEGLADYIERIKPSLVQVSLYSMDPKVHDSITQVKGSFRKTFNALEMLFERNVPIEISCPCMSVNAHGYEKVLSFADEHKIRVCSDCVLHAKYNGENGNLRVRMSDGECEAVLRKIISHERQYGITSEAPDEANCENHESKICDIGVDSIRVNANGDYYVCPCFQGFPVGNCFRESLQHAWRQSPRLAYLRSLKRSALTTCLQCPNLEYCKPCMVRNYTETGDLFKPSLYFCRFSEMIRRLS